MLTNWADKNPEKLREFVQTHHRHLIYEMVQTGENHFTIRPMEGLTLPEEDDE